MVDDEILDSKKRTHLDVIFGWVVGLLFMYAAYNFLESSLVVAIIMFVLGLLLIPLTREIIQDNIKLKLTTGHTYVFIIIGFLIAGYVLDAGNKETTITLVDEQSADLSAQQIPEGSQASETGGATTKNQVNPTNPTLVNSAGQTSEDVTGASTQTTTLTTTSIKEIPADNAVVTVPSTYKFKQEKLGITLFIEDIVFEELGDEFGKITQVKYTVVNNAGKDIQPALKVLVYETGQDPSAWANKVLENSGTVVKDGTSTSEKGLVEMTIPKAINKKTLKFMLFNTKDQSAYLTFSEEIQFMKPQE